MEFVIALLVFMFGVSFLETIIKECKNQQKRELRKKIREEQAEIQKVIARDIEIEARKKQIEDDQAFRQERNRIILEQIKSGERIDNKLFLIKLLLVLIFIVLGLLIPYVILLNR